MNKIILTLIAGLVFISPNLNAQNLREEYIKNYKDWAIIEMHRTGIPASITLAQGILESGNGQSRLAKEANNHFGIKCHSSWQGKTIRKDDDERDECFRKYPSAYDSYKDHSNFLVSGSRYDFLFELDKTDYKAWAKGLKKAGYATNRSYAKRLIKIIEENQLFQYDIAPTYAANTKTTSPKKSAKQKKNYEGTVQLGRIVKQNNRVNYIIAKQSDSYPKLAQEFEMMNWEIYRYNDAQKGDQINEGEIIYLKPKKRKAERKYKIHLVEEGDTWRSIAQKYAIKMKRLKKKNAKKGIVTLELGEKVFLR